MMSNTFHPKKDNPINPSQFAGYKRFQTIPVGGIYPDGWDLLGVVYQDEIQERTGTVAYYVPPFRQQNGTEAGGYWDHNQSQQILNMVSTAYLLFGLQEESVVAEMDTRMSNMMASIDTMRAQVSDLPKTEKELDETKQALSVLTEAHDKLQAQLADANMKLARAQEQLKESQLSLPRSPEIRLDMTEGPSA